MSSDSKLKEEKLEYKCEICGRCFPSFHSLSSHIGWHTNGKRSKDRTPRPREERVCSYGDCSETFICRVGSMRKYCSVKCSDKDKIGKPSKKRLPREERVCKLQGCNTKFICRVDSTKRYCSIECTWKARRGKKAWNKGLTKETDERMTRLSKKKKGKPSWTKGLTKETDTRIAHRAARQKGKIKHTPEGRKRISRSSSKSTKRLWKDPVYVAKQMKARGVKPNKPEKFLNKLLQKLFPKEWKYVGDGQFILGGKCPDFININGQKKIIELFGDYWHSKGRTGIPEKQHEQERKDTFASYGYQTLIIWEGELEDMEVVVTKITSFSQD